MWSEGIVEDGIKPFLISTMRFQGGPNSIYLSISLSIHVIYTYTLMYIGIWHQVFIIIYYVHDIPANMNISNKYMYIATAYSFLTPAPFVVGTSMGGTVPLCNLPAIPGISKGDIGPMPVLQRSLIIQTHPRWDGSISGNFLRDVLTSVKEENSGGFLRDNIRNLVSNTLFGGPKEMYEFYGPYLSQVGALPNSCCRRWPTGTKMHQDAPCHNNEGKRNIKKHPIEKS